MVDVTYTARPTRTSKAAIFSLVCGVFFCVPIVTNLGAIVFGLVGLRKTREEGVRGRGLAWAGLSMGLIALLVWGGIFGSIAYATYKAKQVYEQYANNFGMLWPGQAEKLVTNFASQDAKRVQETIAPGMEMGDIVQLQREIRSLGKLDGVALDSFVPTLGDQETKFDVTSRLKFQGGDKRVRLVVVIDREGNMRIEGFEFIR